MDEVKATTKDVFSCTDDNMTKTHLFLDPHTIATNTSSISSKTAIETSANDHV